MEGGNYVGTFQNVTKVVVFQLVDLSQMYHIWQHFQKRN